VRMQQVGVRGAPRVVEVELTRDDIAQRSRARRNLVRTSW
jgi:hypothetical protein